VRSLDRVEKGNVSDPYLGFNDLAVPCGKIQIISTTMPKKRKI
jgi:hypothetical protein